MLEELGFLKYIFRVYEKFLCLYVSFDVNKRDTN